MVVNPKFKEGVLESRLARAKASRKRCFYKLGRGGFNPKYPLDATWDKQRSDCTGWISYLLMTQRAPKPGRDFWIETTAIYNDARYNSEAFVRIDRPIPGCMVVYPDKNGSEGHIGLIIKVLTTPGPNGGVFERVTTYDTLECASGIQGRLGNAIRERKNAHKLFESKGAIYICLAQDLE